MKIKKLVLCIIILFIILSCTYKKEDNFESISEYVNENYEELEKIAKEYIKGNNVDYPKIISNISVHGKDDIYVFSNNTIVEFMVKGYGLVPSSTYIGFYYSENDIPAAFQNENRELNKIKQNRWEWIGTGDNHGITIKIRNNWYYYEASF